MSEFLKGLTGAFGQTSVAGAAGNALGGAIQSGLDGLGNLLFGGIVQRRNLKYQKQGAEFQQGLQHETMDKQLQMAKEMFDYENAYNDPKEVVKRYKAAGINPLAAFGGQAVGQGATSVPSFNASSPPGLSLAQGTDVSSPAENAYLGSQMRNLDSKTNQNDVYSRLLESQIIGQDLANSMATLDLDYKEYIQQNRKDLSDEELKAARAQAEELQNRAKLTLQQFLTEVENTKLKQKDIELVEQTINEKIEQIAILQIERQWAGKIKEAEYNQLIASASHLFSLAKQSEAQSKYINSMQISQDQKNELFKATAEYEKLIKQAEAHKASRDTTKLADICDGIGRVTGTVAGIVGVAGDVVDIVKDVKDIVNPVEFITKPITEVVTSFDKKGRKIGSKEKKTIYGDFSNRRN